MNESDQLTQKMFVFLMAAQRPFLVKIDGKTGRVIFQ